MRITRVFRMAWTQMTRRKTRTALTTSGIVVGIMAMVAISAISTGFQTQITNDLTTFLDMDIIVVQTLGWGFIPNQFILQQNDSDFIATIPGVIGTSPEVTYIGTHYNDTHSRARTVIGVNYTHFWTVHGNKLTFTEGGMPDPVMNNSVILGSMVTFGFSVGDEITLGFLIREGVSIVSKNYTFRVEGILDAIGLSGQTPIDTTIFLPLNSLQNITNSEALTAISTKLEDPNLTENVITELQAFYGNKIIVYAPVALIASVNSIFMILEVFLLSIASIALLVAGVSILNIMLISVMERTREIGILKALGARNRVVLGQFLTEALLLGIIGGILGIIIGYLLAFGIAIAMPIMFQIMLGVPIHALNPVVLVLPSLTPQLVLFTMAVSILNCILFGLYPARKAANINIMDALRYE